MKTETIPSRPDRQTLEKRRAELQRNLARVNQALAACSEETAPARHIRREPPSLPAFDHPLPVGAG